MVNFVPFLIAAGLSATTAVIITIAANLIIAAIVGKILAPSRPPSGTDVKALQRTFKSNIAPRRVAYGESIVGGPYLYLETEGFENEHLRMINVLTGHPIEDILGVFLDDKYIDISGINNDSNDLTANYMVDEGRFGTGEHVKIIKVLGYGYADNTYVTDETAYAQSILDKTRAGLINTDIIGDWSQGSSTRDSGTGLYSGSGHRVTNCAYIYISLKFDKDVWSGFPNIKFHIKGKKLYNPYEDNTKVTEGANSAGTHRIDNGETWEYSENWGLACLDYLLDTSYGLAVKTEGTLIEVDWAEAIQAHLDSAELIPNGYAAPNIGNVPRYTINGIFEVNSTPITIMESLLASGAGFMVYSQGKYKLRAGKYRAPNTANDIINEDMINGPLTIRTHTPRGQLFNKVAGLYVESGYDAEGAPTTLNLPIFEPTDFPIVDPLDSSGNNPYEVIDGEEIIQEIDLPYTIYEHEAQRLARIQLERIRQGLLISFKADLEILKYSAGDTVYLEILSDSKYASEGFFNRLGLDDSVQDRPDTPFTAYFKQFTILDVQYSKDFTIEVFLLEESEEIYDFNEGDANKIDYILTPSLIVDDPTGIVLPASFVVASPDQTITEVSTGTDINTLIKWTAPERGSIVNAVDRAHIRSYRLEYGIVDNPTSASALRVSEWIHGSILIAKSENLVQGPIGIKGLYINAGVDYDFRLKATTYSGRSSVWVYYSEDIGSDFSPTAPVGASRFYIKPTNGTAIKNGVGTLTVEAREVTAAGDNLLTTGDIQLYVSSTTLVTTANGFASPSDGYTGSFDAGDITDSIVVELRDGSGGTLLDTISLVDIDDGSIGGQAIFAYIEATNGLAWTQAINAGSWNPVATSTNLDITVLQGGTELARWSRQINRNSVGILTDGGATTHAGGNLNTGDISVAISGASSQALTVEYTYLVTPDIVIIAETIITSRGGSDGGAGDDAVFYYIKPIDGTAIHNGSGTLTIEAHKVTGGTDILLSTGTIKLFDPSNNIVTTANDYVSPSDGYTGILDTGDISGAKIITLKDGVGGTVLDTITLVDIADGATGAAGGDGSDATHGFIEPSNGLAWSRAIDAGSWTPAGTTTDLDVTFVKGGSTIARWGYRVTLNTSNGTFSGASTTHPLGNLNTGNITINTSGSGSTAITVEFVHASPDDSVVAETVNSVQGGDSGTDGDDGRPGLPGASFLAHYDDADSDGSSSGQGKYHFLTSITDTSGIFTWSTITTPSGIDYISVHKLGEPLTTYASFYDQTEVGDVVTWWDSNGRWVAFEITSIETAPTDMYKWGVSYIIHDETDGAGDIPTGTDAVIFRWSRAFAGEPSVNLTGHTITDSTGGDSTATVRLNNDGTIDQFITTGGLSQIDATTDWVRPEEFAPGAYEHKATATGAALDGSSDPLNTWASFISLPDPEWSVRSTGAEGSKQAIVTIEIRFSGGTVLDSGIYTLNSDDQS